MSYEESARYDGLAALVVAPLPEQVHLYSETLERAGIRAVRALSLRRATEALRSHEIDVVVVDAHATPSAAVDSIHELFEDPDTPQCPVVLLVSVGFERETAAALDRGVENFLVRDYEGSYLRLLPALVSRASRDAARQVAAAKVQGLYGTILDTAGEGIIGVEPSGRILFANPAAARMLRARAEELVGEKLVEYFRQDGSRIAWSSSEMYRACSAGEICRRDCDQMERPDGSTFPIEFTASPRLNARRELEAVVVVFQDITARKEAEERLVFLSQYDSLTHLANRSLFRDSLHRAIARADRSGKRLGLLFIDVDRFKLVNDTYGHEGGDRLLKAVGGRLDASLRTGDLVGRLGGDEFAVLIEQFDHPDAATNVAAKILEAMAPPFDVLGDEVFVTPSIGIATYPECGTEAGSLLKSADLAMYGAKEAGGNCFHYYSREMRSRVAQRLSLDQELHQAVQLEQFELQYQPKLDVDSREIVGFEALLRWRHPEGELLEPASFLNALEHTGLVRPVGGWVLREALRQTAEWQRIQPKLQMSVNVSFRQLMHHQFRGQLADLLDETAVPAESLELELQEKAFPSDLEEVDALLRKIRRLGVRLAIDDFGSGYSSLQYLRRLPVQTIKLGRLLIGELPGEENDRLLVRTLTSLVNGLGLRVVAQGVETNAQLDFLRTARCDEYQGYLTSRPLDAADATKLLERRSTTGDVVRLADAVRRRAEQKG